MGHHARRRLPRAAVASAGGALLLLLAGLGGTGAAPPPKPASAVDLVPHRAAYRLSLAGSERSLDLVEADGVLGIEWRAECDGWASRQLLAFTAFTQDGEELSYDVRFSSWESRDRDRMRFSVRRFDADGLDEEFRGEAVLEDAAGGGGGEARFTAPETRTVALPPGTVFPTEHMQSVLASARSGERFVSHEVFDGSGFDALTQVTAAIGRPSDGDAGGGGATAAGGAADGDRPGRSWPVSMAYHGVAERGDLPDFEAAFVVDDGGVLRELVLDYGEFQLSAELENLEELPPPRDCR